ncbi:MAG: c-type cytochrome [Pseudomonadota bacterium]
MRKLLLSLIALGGIGLALFWGLTRPASVSDAEVAGLTGDPVAGEQIFWAAGCASCHAGAEAEGEARLILAGGQRFPSDFGTFHAPNISPHPDVGIGGWTLAEFTNALQNGVSPEGRHYYPAFPYTAYRLMERQDIADLYAFMQTLPAVNTPSLPHEVGFPFSIRRLVGGWNLLFLNDDYVLQGDLSPEVERGRYLSEALAHCAECHTPRNALGALDTAAWMSGAPDFNGPGRVPALTPDELDWSVRDIAAYLNDGFTPEFDAAGGHMVSVIRNMAMLPETDRLAIAEYLKALPVPETPVAEDAPDY